MILGAAPSSPAPAPCCADCAPPAQRRKLRQRGAGLVVGMAFHPRRRRGPYPELLGDLETDWVPKRTEIDSATEELNGKILAFQRETVDQLSSIPDGPLQGFLREWNAFISEWQDWRGDSLWLLTWRRRNQLLAYRDRLNKLFAYWKGLPGATATTVPTYTAPEAGKDKPSDPWTNAIKWVAVGAIALGGAVAIGHITGAVKSFSPAGIASSALARRNPSRPRRRRRRNPCY
jgi:hypothetical protein